MSRREQFLYVFRYHVVLKVHRVAHFRSVECCCSLRVRYQRNGECRPLNLGDGKAYALYRYASFLYYVSHQRCGTFHPQPHGVVIAGAAAYCPRAVYVALHYMTAQA